jgi:RNA polymerase sigma factor (sigma-70 family)
LSAEKAAQPDRVVTVPIEIRPPRERELQSLDPADRLLVERLFLEPIEYVDHPAFHEPDAEATLFGGPSELAANSTWFVERVADELTAVAHSRLDVATERLAFQRFNFARMRIAEIIAAHAGRHLSACQWRLLLGWMHRSLMIRGYLAQSNIALVIAMSRRPQFADLDQNDVVSAGNYALLRSIDRFDCSRGYKFSTYACQGILQRILHVVESTHRYRSRFTAEFDETLERDDSPERRHRSQEQEWVDTLRDIIMHNEARLTDLECEVIKQRFGLSASDDAGPLTLQEIGRRMGVTKERVRQIQMRALSKLRCVMECLMS